MHTPVITDLTQTERAWIESQLGRARELVGRYSQGDEWNPFRLEALDRVWTSWLHENEKQTNQDEINSAINAVGIAFGSILVESGLFDWVIVSDDHGTDLAVRALPRRGDVVVFPANFVAKRWEKRETDFLADGYGKIIDHVAKTKADWDKV
jgi:hypothetical protein